MKRNTIGLSACSIVIVVAACASSPPEPTSQPATGDANRITRAEIDRGQWSDIFDLVRNLRPRWIEARGSDSIHGEVGEVQVYVDGTRLGGVDRLRDMPTSAIHHLEWVDPITAAGRWGSGHAHGVIVISYRPAG